MSTDGMFFLIVGIACAVLTSLLAVLVWFFGWWWMLGIGLIYQLGIIYVLARVTR